MTLEHLIAFNIALIVSILSPGPAFLVAVQTTLSSGRAAGVQVGLGLAVVAGLWTLAGLLGLVIVFDLFPWAYTAAKTAGALYLLYIAYVTWRGAHNPVKPAPTQISAAFKRGVLVNSLNPKSALFAAAVLVVIFPPNLTAIDNAIIVANHFLIEVCFYTGLAFMMSTPRVKDRYLKAKATLDKLSAVILGGFGIRLLVDR